MMRQAPSSYAHQRGPSRDDSARDRSYASLHRSTRHRNTPHSTTPRRRRARAQNQTNETRYERNDSESDSDIDLEPNTYRDPPPHQRWSATHQQHPHYQGVPRPWEIRNPEATRLIHDPALADHTPRRQWQPPPPPPPQPQHQTRQLGMSNLLDLNSQNEPASALYRRVFEAQRDGPFDGVGYVGRRSDYEGREDGVMHDENERYYNQSRRFSSDGGR